MPEGVGAAALPLLQQKHAKTPLGCNTTMSARAVLAVDAVFKLAHREEKGYTRSGAREHPSMIYLKEEPQ